jgi:predicted AAA+ superfamily ATPase
MYARILNPPKESFFLFGPRGTGKTSWLKSHFPKAIYIDLLKNDVLNDLRAGPHRLWQMIPTNYTGPVIIDEIQKLPSLLNEIHSAMNESRTKYQFILTGSSARKLRMAGVNLLAGRVRVKNFFPFVAKELGTDFNLKKALIYGLLPEAYTSKDPQSYLESYLQVYIDQEVRLEGLVRNVEDFSRFLEAASFSQASVLNVSNVSSDCGVPRKTVQSYFEILNDLMLAYRLPIFQRKAKREMIKHDKFYFFDPGVFQTIRPRGVLDSDSEINGAAIETLVLTQLHALNELLSLGYQLSYWHTKKHLEVDFILYGKKDLIAIEVKAGSKPKSRDLDGLKEFKIDYPSAKLLFLYGGITKKIGDIQLLNIEDFFANMLKWI